MVPPKQNDLSFAGFHFLGGVLDSLHDVLVPGAAAQIPGQRLTDFQLRRIGIRTQQFNRRENHSRSAETALQTETIPETL
jgi:hypothetical protein